MSEELKDFRYYADKAEEYLDAYKELDGAYTRQAAETLLRTAAVYAELAKAAPKAEPEPRYIIMTPEQARDYEAMKGDK